MEITNSGTNVSDYSKAQLSPIELKPRQDFSRDNPEANKSTGYMELAMLPDHALKQTVDIERVGSEESRPSRKAIRMKCFECNRPEGHHLAPRSRWLYSFTVGLTFGLVLFVGPFQCQCCGSSRLMARNEWNIKYWMKVWRDRRSSVD